MKIVDRAVGDVTVVDLEGKLTLGDGAPEFRQVVDALVALAIEARGQARERKDYAQADALRDRLSEAGIVLEDTPDGVRWRLA